MTGAVQEVDMPRMKEKPRYNVVSMRVTDEELEALERATRKTRKNVSSLMREAMWLLQRDLEGCDRRP
jgi:hypothetical protein